MVRRKSDRVDEYVRHATRLGPEQAAALNDPEPRQALFEEITRTPAAGSHPERDRQPAWRRVRLAAAVIAVVAVIGGIVAVSGAVGPRLRPPAAFTPSSATHAPPPSGDRGDLFPYEAASCIVRYPTDLAKAKFAFDGTVTAIGTTPIDDPAWPTGGGPDLDVPVTFAVNNWYRGGNGSTITVAMTPPGVLTSTQLAQPSISSYQVGSRLLVSSGWLQSGDGRAWKIPKIWTCGFTRWHTAEDAALWDEVFK